MLKIKDNVDLKELEKYGFKRIVYDNIDLRNEIDWKNSFNFYINERDDEFPCRERLIDGNGKNYMFDAKDLDLLYDLISDGLVEKVSVKQ